MHNGVVAFVSIGLLAGAFFVMMSDPAEARRCYAFEASHNGTDMFNPDGGAEGTAKNKLLYAIESWRREKGYKRVRIGRVKTKCGGWYIKYLLPHRTCTARARVCH